MNRFVFFFCLVFPSVASASMPDYILRKIEAQAKQDWPDDKRMQQHVIWRQKAAYSKVKGYQRPWQIPAPVFNFVKTKAASEWPIDFTMQLHTIKRQLAAVRGLQNLKCPVRLDPGAFQMLCRMAIEKWPGDYVMQLKEIQDWLIKHGF